jgi:hypothetical protein
MPTDTIPTRRRALFGAAAITSLLTAPALARVVAPADADTPPGADAELIALCDEFVSVEIERALLYQYDESAPDFGPNNPHYEQLGDETTRLTEAIEAREPPTTAAGCAAMARAALTWANRDVDGAIMVNDTFDVLVLKVLDGMTPGFVFPPLPGSCSTAHWLPPTSAAEIAEHAAEHAKKWAAASEKIAAEKAAKEAEDERQSTPGLLSDDELLGQWKASQFFRKLADVCDAGLADEMARRGLA